MISTAVPDEPHVEAKAGDRCPGCPQGALQLFSISFAEDLLMCNTCLYPLDATDAAPFLRPSLHAHDLLEPTPSKSSPYTHDSNPGCDNSIFDLSEPRADSVALLPAVGEKRASSSLSGVRHSYPAKASKSSGDRDDRDGDDRDHCDDRDGREGRDEVADARGTPRFRAVVDGNGLEDERDGREEQRIGITHGGTEAAAKNCSQEKLGWRLFEQIAVGSQDSELRRRVAQLKAAVDVGCCGDEQISEKVTGATLRGLLPGRWMGDGAVNVFLSVLVRDYPCLGYLNCSLPPLLMESPDAFPEVCSRAAEQLRHGEIDALLVPLHVSDRRGLCVVSGDGTCYVLDALTSKDSRLAMAVDGLQTWLQYEFPLIEWQFYHPRSAAMRAFATDSCAFTCLCAVAFAHLSLDDEAATASAAEFVQAFTGLVAKAPDASRVRDAVLLRVVETLGLPLHSGTQALGGTATTHAGLVDMELNQEIERELRESSGQYSLSQDGTSGLDHIEEILPSPVY